MTDPPDTTNKNTPNVTINNFYLFPTIVTDSDGVPKRQQTAALGIIEACIKNGGMPPASQLIGPLSDTITTGKIGGIPVSDAASTALNYMKSTGGVIKDGSISGVQAIYSKLPSAAAIKDGSVSYAQAFYSKLPSFRGSSD